MANRMPLSAKWLGVICIGIVLLGVLTVWWLRVTTISRTSLREGSGIAVKYPFMLSIITEKDTYFPSETVKMTITLENIGEENTTITFVDRPNPSQYWFWRVYDENGGVVFYYKAVGMIPATQDMFLSIGASVQRNCTWDQKNTDTEEQVPIGIYYLTSVVGFIYNGTDIVLEPQKRITVGD
jgi:hypothetical protein